MAEKYLTPFLTLSSSTSKMCYFPLLILPTPWSQRKILSGDAEVSVVFISAIDDHNDAIQSETDLTETITDPA
jgi:hypothetical protein